MDFTSYEQFFSPNRMHRYVQACGGDTLKATVLYNSNIELSQAYYPLISILEVALRNGIDTQLTKYFSDPQWLLTKRSQFANHPAMTYKNNKGIVTPDHFFSDKIHDAEQKLRYRKIPITHGKLLAELTFGFWVKFFDPSPIKILKGAQINAFKNSPKMSMTLVHSHLNHIVALRNRISHSEPICFDRNGKLCLMTVNSYETDICSAIEWIDPKLKAWSNHLNLVKPIVSKISSL
jgi:hypothetical protein